MKSKRICAGMMCILLLILSCIPAAVSAAPDDGRTVEISGVTFSAAEKLENKQQSGRPWGNYKVSGSQNSIAAAGCGVLSVCNALHYATGYFPDPAQLAEWANRSNAGYNGDWTEGTIFFSRFVDEFGDGLGFHTAVFEDREGSQNLPRVRTFINDVDAKDVLIDRYIRNGAAMSAYVENHFLAIVDYNSMTDRFLVWDNNAGDTNGGRRAGITHEAGDWFTWEEMRGTLKNASGDEFQFCIEYVIPILPTEGRQLRHVSRDGLTVGGLMLQKPGECCNFTPVNTRQYAGQSLEFTGSCTSVGQIDRIGYRVNGGKTVFLADALETASEDALEEGRVWCGEDAGTVGFRVAIPIGASDKQYDIVISEDGAERVIWTAVVTTKNTGEPIVIGSMESESGSSGEETVPAETTADASNTAEPAETAGQPRERTAGAVIAAAVIGAVCAVSVPIVFVTVKAGKKRGSFIAAAAGMVCVCLIVILLTCISGRGHEPQTGDPAQDSVPTEEALTLSEETETGDNADEMKEQYDRAAALMDEGDFAGALDLFAALRDFGDSRSLTEECEKQLLKDAAVGDSIRLGAYEQDNDGANGKELIEWRVLARDGDKLLVISEKALDCQPYNETFWSTTWERCTLRTWLNRDFLSEAFSKTEQSLIVKAKVSADGNPDHSTAPGGVTSDRIFLLSIPEAEQYLGTKKDRRCSPTAYAVAQGAWSSSLLSETGTPACCWWLRTPGSTVFDAAYVHYRGTIASGGKRVMSVSTVCVRPAMWIKAGG